MNFLFSHGSYLSSRNETNCLMAYSLLLSFTFFNQNKRTYDVRYLLLPTNVDALGYNRKYGNYLRHNSGKILPVITSVKALAHHSNPCFVWNTCTLTVIYNFHVLQCLCLITVHVLRVRCNRIISASTGSRFRILYIQRSK